MRRTLVWPPVLEGGRATMTPDPDEDAPDSGMCLRQTIALGLLDGHTRHCLADGHGGPTDPDEQADELMSAVGRLLTR